MKNYYMLLLLFLYKNISLLSSINETRMSTKVCRTILAIKRYAPRQPIWMAYIKFLMCY